MSRTLRTRARGVAALAAAATLGSVVPLLGATAAHAAACTVITGLTSADGLGRPADPTVKDLVLSWAPVTGAGGYEVQVSPNQDFANNVALDTTTVASRLEVPQQSFKHASYFWRVRTSGSTCWSDDGTTNAATFSTAWHDRPTALAPTGTVSRDRAVFRWSAVPDASLYELDVYDVNDRRVGQCFTDHTEYAPYDLVAGDDRSTGSCFGLGALGFRQHYTWTVVGIDTTGRAVNGSPYASLVAGNSGAKPSDAYSSPGTVQVSSVAPGRPYLEGDSGGGDVITVKGSGFVPDAPPASPGGQPVKKTHVSFDGTQLEDGAVTYVNPSTLTVTVPSHTGHGTVDVVVTAEASGSTKGGTSAVTAYSKWTYVDGQLDPRPAEVAKGELSQVTGAAFGTDEPAVLLGALPAVSAATIDARQLDTRGNGSSCVVDPAAAAAAECGTTPEISWAPVAGATGYRVSLWEDGDLTQLERRVDTHAPTLLLRDSLLDNQAPFAGSRSAYYVTVQACDDNGCFAPSTDRSFRKRSAPTTLVSPVDRAVLAQPTVTLAWADMQVDTGLAQEAAHYRVDIASDCDFTQVVESASPDQPSFTSTTNRYADGLYYWRVQAIDQSGNPLTFGNAPNRATTCNGARSFTVQRTPPPPPAGPGTTPGSTPGGTGTTGTTGTTGSGGVTRNGLPLVIPATVDSAAAVVRRSGTWRDRRSGGALHGAALVAGGARRERLALTFLGSTVRVGYCTGPMNGSLAVYVDGRLQRVLSGYRSFTRCGRDSFTVGSLDPTRTHVVEVRATGLRGARRGTQLAVDYFATA